MRRRILQAFVFLSTAPACLVTVAGPAPVFELLPDGTKVRAGKTTGRQSDRRLEFQQERQSTGDRVHVVPGRTRPGASTKKIRISRSAPRHRRPPADQGRIPAPTRTGLMHIVRRGETLHRIAGRYRVGTGYLARVNHLKAPYRLYPGQALIIVRRKASSSEIARLNYLLRKKNISPITYVTSPKRVRRRLIDQRRLRRQPPAAAKRPQRDDPYVAAYRTRTPPGAKQDSQKIGSEEEMLPTDRKKAGLRQNNGDRIGAGPTLSRKTSTIRQNEWGNRTRRSRIKNSRKGRAAQRSGHGPDAGQAGNRQQVAKLSGNFSRQRNRVGHRRLPRAAVFQRRRKVRWRWPTRGSIVRRYSKQTKGIDIAGQYGQPVRAAASGLVVYIGNSLIRYGNLVILKHSKSYFSAYAHNQRLLVKKGQVVRSGQKIAEMGSTGTSRVKLHFEIRKDGKSVDPLRYLPRR